VAAGLLDAAAAERRLATSYRVLAGLKARHRHDLHAWLSELGNPADLATPLTHPAAVHRTPLRAAQKRVGR